MASTSSSSSASGSYTGKARPFRFDSPAGKDVLLVRAFTAEEAVSEPFLLTVDLVSDKSDVAPDKLLGAGATLTMNLVGGGERMLHGIVRRFAQMGRSEGLTSYRAEIVPRLWFLSRTQESRIFQNLSVPEIVEKVLKQQGVSDFSIKAVKTYPKREYCVQYRESHLAFISRLLEEEGIFYFFEHTADKHTLVLADGTSAVKPCNGLKSVRMNTGVGDAYDQNVVVELARENAVTIGTVALRAFDFVKPTANLGAQSDGDGKGEVYDYPGAYTMKEEGDRYARIRLEEAEAVAKTVTGQSNVRAFVPGCRFDLTDHYRKDVNQSYQLLRVRHEGRVEGFRSGETQTERYSNDFVATPFSVVYRPPRHTPRPLVHGTQTAIVVGKSGEEIWVDKYGRVKLHFHWDREGKKDENSSCWVRVSTTWAGKQWGTIQLPRIGQEVIVDFLEGDPDQPIVVGRVYNGDNMPPYALPANGTQSGVLSRSSKGGGAANANEFRFEDKKGSEQVFLHAEKNQDIEVENDETHWVGHDRTKTIDHDETVHVKHDRTETVDNNETITIGKNRTESVGENETLTVTKDRTRTVNENESLTIAKNRTLTVGESVSDTFGKDHAVAVGANVTIDIGSARTTNVGKDDALTVSGAQTITVSKDIAIKSNDGITLQAMNEITLKCGAATLVLKKDGTIQLDGVQISVKASAKLGLEASASAELKSSGILQVQGSLVKIN